MTNIPMTRTESWGPQPAWTTNPVCGNRALWDHPSDMGYRCQTCFAMLSSAGMPEECRPNE
jgi:hypothetical protein